MRHILHQIKLDVFINIYKFVSNGFKNKLADENNANCIAKLCRKYKRSYFQLTFFNIFCYLILLKIYLSLS